MQKKTWLNFLDAKALTKNFEKKKWSHDLRYNFIVKNKVFPSTILFSNAFNF